MSESKFETVSSLVDNYQSSDEAFEQTINDKKCTSEAVYFLLTVAQVTLRTNGS